MQKVFDLAKKGYISKNPMSFENQVTMLVRFSSLRYYSFYAGWRTQI